MPAVESGVDPDSGEKRARGTPCRRAVAAEQLEKAGNRRQQQGGGEKESAIGAEEKFQGDQGREGSQHAAGFFRFQKLRIVEHGRRGERGAEAPGVVSGEEEQHRHAAGDEFPDGLRGAQQKIDPECRGPGQREVVGENGGSAPEAAEEEVVFPVPDQMEEGEDQRCCRQRVPPHHRAVGPERRRQSGGERPEGRPSFAVAEVEERQIKQNGGDGDRQDRDEEVDRPGVEHIQPGRNGAAVEWILQQVERRVDRNAEQTCARRLVGVVVAVVKCPVAGVDGLLRVNQKVVDPEGEKVRRTRFDERVDHVVAGVLVPAALRVEPAAAEQDGEKDCVCRTAEKIREFHRCGSLSSSRAAREEVFSRAAGSSGPAGSGDRHGDSRGRRRRCGGN